MTKKKILEIKWIKSNPNTYKISTKQKNIPYIYNWDRVTNSISEKEKEKEKVVHDIEICMP